MVSVVFLNTNANVRPRNLNLSAIQVAQRCVVSQSRAVKSQNNVVLHLLRLVKVLLLSAAKAHLLLSVVKAHLLLSVAKAHLLLSVAKVRRRALRHRYHVRNHVTTMMLLFG